MQLRSFIARGAMLAASLCLGTAVLAQDTGKTNSDAQKTMLAEKYPDLVELDPFGGISMWGQVNKGLGEKLVNGGAAGGRLALNVTKHIGLEVSYTFMENNVRLVTPIRPGLPSYNFGDQIHHVALNAVYNLTPRGSRLQPYVTAGVGEIQFNPTRQATDFAKLPATAAVFGSQGLRHNGTNVAFNYGGGVKFHISPHLGLRFDVRGLLTKNPTFGLPSFNDNGIYIPSKSVMNGLQATAGFVYYFGQAAAPVTPAVKAAEAPPINAGEIVSSDTQLCQGKPVTVHSTASDPAGHALSYAWKLNGNPEAGTGPDFSFKPNNAGDFKVEVAITDTTNSARTAYPPLKTFTVQDYAAPQIASVTAAPNDLTCSADASGVHMANLAAQVTGSACGGTLTYKWAVSEGSVTNDTSPNATFDASSLNFESGGGQAKTVNATLTATDETGKSVSQSAAINVTCPAQFKRLPDIVFAKNSARVNNCGKRILIEQAAPQAGSAYDVLLVAHRSADEMQRVPAAGRRRSAAARSLDEQRALNAAAILTGDHGSCANLDPTQIKMDLAGTDQTSAPDPGLCGTSNLPQTTERRSAKVSEADKERRVEVYLVPKNTQAVPPAAKNARSIPEAAVKALGCPK